MVPYNTVFLNKLNGAGCSIPFWDEVPALCASASPCFTAWAKWHWSDNHNLWLFMGPIHQSLLEEKGGHLFWGTAF